MILLLFICFANTLLIYTTSSSYHFFLHNSISLDWCRHWLINGGEGRCWPCSWIPQQPCCRNGICNTGKSALFFQSLDLSYMAFLYVTRRIYGRDCTMIRCKNISFFLIFQGETPEELPEVLLGTCRFNHLDVSKAVSTDSISKNGLG